MKGVKFDLSYLQDNASNLDIEIKNKLSKSLKYYLARACMSVRNPKLIQLNHYVEELYGTVNSNSRKIIFSPATVPLPIAAYVNCNLINDLESKLFIIDREGNIENHALEIIIPAMVALFSGSSLTKEFKYNGSLLLASLILSSEIAVKLSELKGFSHNKGVSIAVVLVASTLMSIDKDSVTYIVGKLLSTEQGFDMRECMELVSMSKYPPHYHRHEASKEVLDLLAQFEEPFLVRSVPVKSLAVERMFFCLPRMSPLQSVVSCCLTRDLCLRTFKALHLSIGSGLVKGWQLCRRPGLSRGVDVGDDIRWFIASVVVMSRSEEGCGADLCAVLAGGWDMGEGVQGEVINVVYDRVSVTVGDRPGDHLVALDVTYDGGSDTHSSWCHDTLGGSLDQVGSVVDDHIVTSMHSVIGVHYTTITSDLIDTLSHNVEVTHLLEPFYHHAALD